jgi:hypothetical protein
MQVSDLKQLKDRIEALNQHHQIQILKIITQNNVVYTENKNGSFVNLTNMDDAVFSKLAEYLSYVDEQETQLKEVENQKTELTKQFFKSTHQ